MESDRIGANEGKAVFSGGTTGHMAPLFVWFAYGGLRAAGSVVAGLSALWGVLPKLVRLVIFPCRISSRCRQPQPIGPVPRGFRRLCGGRVGRGGRDWNSRALRPRRKYLDQRRCCVSDRLCPDWPASRNFAPANLATFWWLPVVDVCSGTL